MAGGSSATVDRVFFIYFFFLLNSLVAPFVTIIRTFQCRRVSVTLSPLSRPPNIKKKNNFLSFFLGWREKSELWSFWIFTNSRQEIYCSIDFQQKENQWRQNVRWKCSSNKMFYNLLYMECCKWIYSNFRTEKKPLLVIKRYTRVSQTKKKKQKKVNSIIGKEGGGCCCSTRHGVKTIFSVRR